MKSVGSATSVVRPTTKCPGGASPVVLLALTLVYMTMRLHASPVVLLALTLVYMTMRLHASPVVLLALTLVYMTMRLHYVHIHSLIPVLRDGHFCLDIITTISQEKY